MLSKTSGGSGASSPSVKPEHSVDIYFFHQSALLEERLVLGICWCVAALVLLAERQLCDIVLR